MEFEYTAELLYESLGGQFNSASIEIYNKQNSLDTFIDKTNPDIVFLNGGVITSKGVQDPLKIVDSYRKKNANTVFISLNTKPFLRIADYLAHQISYFMEMPFKLNTLNDFLTGTEENKYLYVLLGPSGSGKSTLKTKFIKSSMTPITKVTTRPYRSENERRGVEVESISPQLFSSLGHSENLEAIHKYRNFQYGMYKECLDEAVKCGRDYVFDTCDVPTAMILKNRFPDTVKTILILPNIYEGKKRFLQREKIVKANLNDLKLINQSGLTVDYLRNQTLQDMQLRVKYLEKEYAYFATCRPFVDVNLYEDYSGNVDELIRLFQDPMYYDKLAKHKENLAKDYEKIKDEMYE